MPYLFKAPIRDLHARTMTFAAQKTMYGGKGVGAGDVIYLFDSETHGGAGLFAKAVVTAAQAVVRKAGVARQTPRVTITVRITAHAKRPLGRAHLKSFSDWEDGRPETELNFRFWRQATDKIGGISDVAAAFIDIYFD